MSRKHGDHRFKSSTQRSETWATETSEAEKPRSRKRQRSNRRLRNHGTNGLRRNPQPRVRRRHLRPYHKAKKREVRAARPNSLVSIPNGLEPLHCDTYVRSPESRGRHAFGTPLLSVNCFPETFRHSLGLDSQGPFAPCGRSAVNPQALRTDASGCHRCSRYRRWT